MLLKFDETYETRSSENNQQQLFNLRQREKTKN